MTSHVNACACAAGRADLGDQVVERFGVAGQREHRRTAFGHRDRRRAADAAGRAGDDDVLADQRARRVVAPGPVGVEVLGPVPPQLRRAGGVLGTSGTHQTFNTLTLTGGGTIDLGTGASIVQFNDSHSQAWSGILRISNWSGSPTGNGTDQLLVGTSALTGLTSAQLAEIHFTGLPTGAKFVANGANGEVVPLSTTPLLIGDLNGDSHVNATDITTMLTALTDLNAYKTAHPTLDSASLTDIADLNSDGAFNNLDLQGLITYLKTGHGSLSAVPEPATYVLLAVALPAMVTVARRRIAKKSKYLTKFKTNSADRRPLGCSS